MKALTASAALLGILFGLAAGTPARGAEPCPWLGTTTPHPACPAARAVNAQFKPVLS